MSFQHEKRAEIREIAEALAFPDNAIGAIDYVDAQLILRSAIRLMNIADEIMTHSLEAAILPKPGE